MNAIEHGNQYRPELPGRRSRCSPPRPSSGCASPTRAASEPIPEAETPDLEAKLEGLQTPRGWGLFLIENMVDEHGRHRATETHHTVELILHLKGDGDASEPL